MDVIDAIDGWAAGTGPIYQRIARAIEAAAERGDLPSGTLLPAERQMAKALAVGRSTVVGAYDILRSSGVVISRQGSGTWISGADPDSASRRARPDALERAARARPEQIIDLATASLEADPSVARALTRTAAEFGDFLGGTHGYSALGVPDLRSALADRFARDGLPTSPEQILVTSGEQQALALLCGEYLTAGSVVVTEDPTSPGLLDLLRHQRVDIRTARSLAAAGAQDLIDAVRRHRPTVVAVQPVLGPEGRIADELESRRFTDAIRDTECILIEDAGSRDLAAAPPPYLALRRPSVVTVGSLSKLYWAGLRIGWLRADENTVLRLSRAKVRADLGTSIPGQRTAALLLGEYDEARSRRLSLLRDRAAETGSALRQAIPGVVIDGHSGAATIWARLPHGPSRAFAELAQRHGVAIVAGDALSPAGAGDAHIRIGLGASMDDLAEGVQRLSTAWAAFAREPQVDSPVLV